MSPAVTVLVVTVCLVLGVVVRCQRDIAVLRRLERLMRGCDPDQRVEVCRILAASLQGAAAGPGTTAARSAAASVPPGRPPTQDGAPVD